jgi:hypothetical protein
LNKPFEGQETLPTSIRVPNFHGTYADYLITVSLHSQMSIGRTVMTDFFSPSIRYSRPTKGSWTQSTQLSLQSSTTSLRT